MTGGETDVCSRGLRVYCKKHPTTFQLTAAV